MGPEFFHNAYHVRRALLGEPNLPKYEVRMGVWTEEECEGKEVPCWPEEDFHGPLHGFAEYEDETEGTVENSREDSASETGSTYTADTENED